MKEFAYLSERNMEFKKYSVQGEVGAFPISLGEFCALIEMIPPKGDEKMFGYAVKYCEDNYCVHWIPHSVFKKLFKEI